MGLLQEEKGITNIDPWRYPREDGSRRPPYDENYYDEEENLRNTIIMDLIHEYVVNGGSYPKIGQEVGLSVALGINDVPEGYDRINLRDAFAYAALYPQNVEVVQNKRFFERTQYNPNQMGFLMPPMDTVRDIVFRENVTSGCITTVTTERSQYPDAQLAVDRGPAWVEFQTKKKSDIQCRMDLLEDNDDNANQRTDMTARIAEIDDALLEYSLSKSSDDSKKLASVDRNLSIEYRSFLHSLLPEDAIFVDDTGEEVRLTNEASFTTPEIASIEMNLVSWWENVPAGGTAHVVYYNQADQDPNALAGQGHYYYTHRTGTHFELAYDRGILADEESPQHGVVTTNFRESRSLGIERILKKLGKYTATSLADLMADGRVVFMTYRHERPGSMWKYAVKIPFSILDALPLAVSAGVASFTSAYTLAKRQKEIIDSTRYRVSFTIAGLERTSKIASNTLRRYDIKILRSGKSLEGVSLFEEAMKIRVLPSIVERLLDLNELEVTNANKNYIEFVFGENFRLYGFFYNSAFYSKGVGFGDILQMSHEEFRWALHGPEESEPCQAASTNPALSRGFYNIFAGYSPTTYGFLFYSHEIERQIEGVASAAMEPWEQFVPKYTFPSPNVIESDVTDIDMSDLRSTLQSMDQNPGKTAEEILAIRDRLKAGVRSAGVSVGVPTSAASALATSRALAFNIAEDSLVNCETLEMIAVSVMHFFRQTGGKMSWKRVMALAINILKAEMHKMLMAYVSEKLETNSESGTCITENPALVIAGVNLLDQLVENGVRPGGAIDTKAVQVVVVRIIDEQIKCLLDVTGGELKKYLEAANPGTDPNLISLTQSALRPPAEFTITKVGSGNLWAAWGRQIIKLLMEYILQLTLSYVVEVLRKAISCPSSAINTGALELASGDIDFNYNPYYGESDMNELIFSSLTDPNPHLLLANYAKTADQNFPTDLQARELHDDISKMVTGPELLTLLDGIAPASLVEEIHEMIYTIGHESLEQGDTRYSDLVITVVNLRDYLEALGRMIPESEKNKLRNPPVPQEGEECVPAGQTFYSALKRAGYTQREISEQIEENLCEITNKLGGLCRTGDSAEDIQAKLQNIFGSSMPPWLRKFFDNLYDLQNDAQNRMSRLHARQIDFDPPGIVNLSAAHIVDDETLIEEGNMAENNNVSSWLSFQTSEEGDENVGSYFRMGKYKAEVDIDANIRITDRNTGLVVSMIDPSDSIHSSRLKGQLSSYNISNAQQHINIENLEITNELRTQNETIKNLILDNWFHMNGRTHHNTISHEGRISEFIRDFYLTTPAKNHQAGFLASIMGTLMIPNADPCIDQTTVYRAQSALEVMRVRVINFILNTAYLTNAYGGGQIMMELLADYIYVRFSKEMLKAGLYRQIASATYDIERVFTEFQDLAGIESDEVRIKAVIRRLYQETTRRQATQSAYSGVHGIYETLETQRQTIQWQRLSNFGRRVENQPPPAWPNQGDLQVQILDLDQALGLYWRYFLPSEVIVALQYIYFDTEYNITDRVPEFDFYAARRIKEADDSFREAISEVFVPKYVPRFQQFPKIIGLDNYFRREDIAQAINRELGLTKATLHALRSTLDRIEKTEQQILFEELDAGLGRLIPEENASIDRRMVGNQKEYWIDYPDGSWGFYLPNKDHLFGINDGRIFSQGLEYICRASEGGLSPRPENNLFYNRDRLLALSRHSRRDIIVDLQRHLLRTQENPGAALEAAVGIAAVAQGLIIRLSGVEQAVGTNQGIYGLLNTLRTNAELRTRRALRTFRGIDDIIGQMETDVEDIISDLLRVMPDDNKLSRTTIEMEEATFRTGQIYLGGLNDIKRAWDHNIEPPNSKLWIWSGGRTQRTYTRTLQRYDRTQEEFSTQLADLVARKVVIMSLIDAYIATEE